MLQFVYPTLELRFWWVAGWERKVFFYQKCCNYCLKKDLVWLGVPPTKQTKGYFLQFSPRYIYSFPIIFSFLSLGFKIFVLSSNCKYISLYMCFTGLRSDLLQSIWASTEVKCYVQLRVTLYPCRESICLHSLDLPD